MTEMRDPWQRKTGAVSQEGFMINLTGTFSGSRVARHMNAGGNDLPDRDLGVFYGLMLSHPEWDSWQIAKRLGLEEQDVRDLLDRLVECSLLQRPATDGGQYLPASPMLAMKQLIESECAVLTASRERLAERYRAIDSAFSQYAAWTAVEDRPAAFEVLAGIDLVQRCLDDLAVQCRSELLAMSPDVGSSPARPVSIDPLPQSALARGVMVRMVYPDTVVHDEDVCARNVALQRAGARIVSSASFLPVMSITMPSIRVALPSMVR